MSFTNGQESLLLADMLKTILNSFEMRQID